MLAILIQGGGLVAVGIWGMICNQRDGRIAFAGPAPWLFFIGLVELLIFVPAIIQRTS